MQKQKHFGMTCRVIFGSLVAVLCAAVSAEPQPNVTTSTSLPITQPTLPNCSSRYQLVSSPGPDFQHTNVSDSIESGFSAERLWGVAENIQISNLLVAEPEKPVLRVSYPAGSSSPTDADKSSKQRGGAGFYSVLNSSKKPERACLSYKLRFPVGFDFVKGGKLPGLYGGEAPSGGTFANGENGFSMRFMWREEGAGELYEYVVGGTDLAGVSVGRGLWIFPTGRWVTLELEVVLNTPGYQDGFVRAWIDERPVLEQQGVVFRNTESVSVGGLMFSTFFGGTGEQWRTPRDQTVDFTDFQLYLPASDV